MNALGHGDSRWFAAIQEQAATLCHTSNLFHTVPQVGGGGLFHRVAAGSPPPSIHGMLQLGRSRGAAEVEERVLCLDNM